jgi:hypothetical protein
MVQAARVERASFDLKDRSSSQLSYACMVQAEGLEPSTTGGRSSALYPIELCLRNAATTYRLRLRRLRNVVEAPAGLESAHCALRRRCSTSELRSRAVVPSEDMTLQGYHG